MSESIFSSQGGEAEAGALEALSELRHALVGELQKVVVGQEAVLEHLIVAMIARGHVLLEGVPGVAKTLMVKALSRAVESRYNRIQFTPDLMPSDVLGTRIFNFEAQSFQLSKGPIFTDLCLVDEINRAPAKTQAALLQAMEEREVSIDGEHFALGPIFMVCATQNPVESEGTYRLPEAQLDRFLLKVQVPYPTAAEEDKILEKVASGFDAHDLEGAGLRSVIDRASLMRVREQVTRVRVDAALIGYIRRLVQATRNTSLLMLGCGPRASIHLLQCARVVAGMRGRGFVTPDDVKFMAYPVMRHRLVLAPELELDGVTEDEVIARLLSQVEVPR